MLKIYYNSQTEDNNKVNINLFGSHLNIKYFLEGYDLDINCEDDVLSLESYTSYILVTKSGNPVTVKKNRTSIPSKCKIININRLGIDTKEDYANILDVGEYIPLVQIDTGIISSSQKDIIISTYSLRKENININTDLEYSLEDITELNGKYPREDLWDNYSLIVNDQEYKFDRWGNMLTDIESIPELIPNENGCVDFTIKKYKGFFTDTELTREIDNEEVYIESSCGVVNNRRVRLNKGIGSFKLYPFGHTGFFKLKLGRKWYRVWNDYSFYLK